MHARRAVVWVDRSKLNSGSGETTTPNGAEVLLHVSPYDLPRRLVGSFDPKGRRFVIDFEYIDDEPASSPVMEDSVTFTEGRHSGKILRIQVPVETPSGVSVDYITVAMTTKAKVLEALKDRRANRLQGVRGIAKRLNQDVVEEVLEKDFDEFAELLA